MAVRGFRVADLEPVRACLVEGFQVVAVAVVYLLSDADGFHPV